MSNDVIYGGLDFDIIYVQTWPFKYQLKEVTGKMQYTTVWGWNTEARAGSALISLLVAFVELFCSGGLAHILLVTVADWLYTSIHNFL
jgi:hypothetical protein